MKIILASKSPRRKEILENLGIEIEIITAETDESSEERDPSVLVRELAERKGSAVAEEIEKSISESDRTFIISSDTVVASDGEILGKPRDLDDARRMLKMLEGRSHSVFSGIAVIEISGGKITKSASATEETLVYFAPMSDSDVEFYINTENVLDKAGAYAIQGIASTFIDKIDGDYFNVVGLPVRRLFRLLSDEFGIKQSELIRKA